MCVFFIENTGRRLQNHQNVSAIQCIYIKNPFYIDIGIDTYLYDIRNSNYARTNTIIIIRNKKAKKNLKNKEYVKLETTNDVKSQQTFSCVLKTLSRNNIFKSFQYQLIPT